MHARGLFFVYLHMRNPPEIPKHTQTWESSIATYWMHESGYLVSNSKPIKRTVANLKENHQLVHSITGGKPIPLLLFLTSSPVPDKAARDYSAEMLPKLYSKMAMVSEPGLSAFVMRLLFKFKPFPIPVKFFTDQEEAENWLQFNSASSGF